MRSFDSPAVSIFSSSGLELQLGHLIKADLRQEFGTTVTNHNRVLIYYKQLTVFIYYSLYNWGRTWKTFALFATTHDKTKEHRLHVNNDHHDQVRSRQVLAILQPFLQLSEYSRRLSGHICLL